MPMENAGDSFAAGLDAKTGKTLWRVRRHRDINWVSPVVTQFNKRAEAIFQTAKDVTAYEPRTGKVLWSLTGRGTSSVASPVQGDGMLFVSGRDTLALRPGGDEPEVAWKSPRLPTGYSSAAYHGGRLYALKPRFGLVCADGRSGKLLWQQRVAGEFSASPVLADGKAYLAGEDGVVTVVHLGKEPEVLASNDMKQKLLATPAVAGGCLYLRSDKTLFCIGMKK